VCIQRTIDDEKDGGDGWMAHFLSRDSLVDAQSKKGRTDETQESTGKYLYILSAFRYDLKTSYWFGLPTSTCRH
jgi:hypothetical protein